MVATTASEVARLVGQSSSHAMATFEASPNRGESPKGCDGEVRCSVTLKDRRGFRWAAVQIAEQGSLGIGTAGRADEDLIDEPRTAANSLAGGFELVARVRHNEAEGPGYIPIALQVVVQDVECERVLDDSVRVALGNFSLRPDSPRPTAFRTRLWRPRYREP